MSDSYSLICHDCKEQLWIGQSSNTSPIPFCFYSGEPETMNKLKHFFWKHQRHHLMMDFSDLHDGYREFKL